MTSAPSVVIFSERPAVGSANTSGTPYQICAMDWNLTRTKMRNMRSHGLQIGLAVVALISALSVGLVLAKNPPLDVCSLLTLAQLQKTLGQPFSSPQKSTAPPAYAGDPSGTQCEYRATQGSPIKAVLIAYVDPSAAHATQT